MIGGIHIKLANNVALVTGGGSGIGREISLTFAHEGASVAVNEVNTKERSTNSCQGGTNAVQAQDQWDIKAGREADFRGNQAALCKDMLEHPGVICYHAYYPSQLVSQWTEIYATDEAFAAHLANEKGKGPLGTLIDACDKIICQCRGNPNAGSKTGVARS